MEDSSTPLIKAAKNMTLFARDGIGKLIVQLAVSGIKTTIADHFKILIRDMAN